MKINKKRTLKLTGKVVLYLLILSLLSIAVYLHLDNQKNSLEITKQLENINDEIKEQKEIINDTLVYFADVDELAELGAKDIAERNRFEALYNATFRLETGNGTSRLWKTSNNAGGIKCGSDTYCSYKNKEQGKKALRSKLKDYVNEFDYNLEAIRYKYCGSHCGQEDLDKFTKIFHEELQKVERETYEYQN